MMKKTVLKALLFAVLAFFFQAAESAHSAQVFISEESATESRSVNIVGDIDRDTVAKAIALADKSSIKHFVLDSGGGDIEAAIELGRYFRRKEASVSVNGTCASSCFILLAGAVSRSIHVLDDWDMKDDPGFKHSSRIGVHRPFTASSFSSTLEATKTYKRTNNLIKDYLEEMNIPASLLDLMNSVSPGDIKWPTQSEVNFYFPIFDPVYQDKGYSKAAAKKGISKEEYIRRIQRSNQECPMPVAKDPTGKLRSEIIRDWDRQQEETDRWVKCLDDVLNGLR